METPDIAALAVLGPFILIFWAATIRVIYNILKYGEWW